MMNPIKLGGKLPQVKIVPTNSSMGDQSPFRLGEMASPQVNKFQTTLAYKDEQNPETSFQGLALRWKAN